MSACTVLIAARDLLEPLRRVLPAGGEVLAFTDAEPLRALETITERRPSMIAIEQLFAESPRGAALINRIRADNTLAAAQIVILAPGGAASRTVHRWEPPVLKPVSDQHGTRRARRVRVRNGIDVLVDGNTARLVDLSAVGAQIMSTIPLKPNSRVRMTLVEDTDTLRLAGQVAWARFEIPDRIGTPLYRVGVEFSDADRHAVEHFCELWKA